MKASDALSCLASVFDEGTFSEIDALTKGDTHIGYGQVGGSGVYGFVLAQAIDPTAAEKIKKIYALAEKTGCPVLAVYHSDGVKLGEGFAVLSAYGEIVRAASRLSGVVPQIAIADGACLGVTAVMANTADVLIAVKDSDLAVAPPSEATAEEFSRGGAVDIIADTFEDAADAAQRLLLLLPANNLAPLPVFEAEAESGEADDIIAAISDNVISAELKQGYAEHVRTVLTTVNGRVAGLAVFDGAGLTAESAYKTAAFVLLCDAYHIPVITVADADGIAEGRDAQTLTAVTKMVAAYAQATCPKLSLITQQACGGAYILLAGKGACADITLAWEDACTSPLRPESAVAFLWNERLAAGEDRAALVGEYCRTEGAAQTAAKAGAIDEIIAPAQTKERIDFYLTMLSSKRETTVPRKHTVK